VRILQNTRERLVLGVGFGPDGRTLVAGGSGGFDVWDLPASKHRFVSAQDSGTIFAFVVDPQGRWLYFSEHRAGGYRYDLKTGEAQRFPGDPYDHHMISIAASSDGSRAAVSRGGAGHNRLECWTIGAGGGMTLAWSVPGPTDTVSFHGLAFSPDGTKIASVEEVPWRGTRTPPHPTILRESLTGKQLSAFGGVPHTLYVQTTFTADGRRLIVWNNEQFSVWDVATSERVGQVPRPRHANFNGLAVHSSGKFFVTAAGDGRARYWDPVTLKQLRALHWEIGKLHSVAFSPDGMLAAAGGAKGQIVVWDVDE